MELTIRPRRLRTSDTLRRMVRETRVSPDSLIYPLFLVEGENIKEPIPSLEGQWRYSPDRVCEEIEECLNAGVSRVLLFGIPAHRMPAAPLPGIPTGWYSRAFEPSRKSSPNAM